MAILLMVVTAAALVAVGVYLMGWGGSLIGGMVLAFLAIPYGTGARALRTGENWGWGAGVLSAVFVVPIGALLLPWGAGAIVPALATALVLYRVRELYGMVRTDPEEEKRTREDLRAQRVANPEGRACPHCGKPTLWIAPDGSAYCESCKAGTISVREPA